MSSISDVTFRNPRLPTVGVHTLRLRELYQRSPAGGPDPAARHRIPVHLLALVTAGRASFHVDFETYPCRPGGLLWVRPGQLVGFPPPGIDATLVLFEPQFPFEAVRAPAITQAETRVAPGTYWQLGGEDSEAILDGISQLEIDYRRLLDGQDVPVAVLRHQLASLLLRLTRIEPDGGPGRALADNELFERFRAAVDERFARTRQVDDYARLLGCSVRTLTRSSLAATGRTAKQLVDDRVALEAKRLLAESDLPVAEVGARLGFSEATNFGRFFTRTVGCSPGAFRAASVVPEEPPAQTPLEQPLAAALAKAGAARGSAPPPPDDIAERGLTARVRVKRQDPTHR